MKCLKVKNAVHDKGLIFFFNLETSNSQEYVLCHRFFFIFKVGSFLCTIIGSFLFTFIHSFRHSSIYRITTNWRVLCRT